CSSDRVDDFCESGSSKGLRGHLSALARGEITTGAIKIIGIPAASIAAAILLRTGTRRTGLFGLARPDEAASWAGRACDIVVTGGVIAGTPPPPRLPPHRTLRPRPAG